MEKNAIKVGAEKQIFFSNFFCRETFEISQKLKALAKFSFYTKVYFRFLAIFSNLNFCANLKNTVLDPMLKNGGKTGRPEFPGDRNFPGKKKNLFFKISKNLKLQIKKSLNEKYVSRNWPSSQIKIFTLSCKIRKRGVIPKVG